MEIDSSGQVMQVRRAVAQVADAATLAMHGTSEAAGATAEPGQGESEAW